MFEHVVNLDPWVKVHARDKVVDFEKAAQNNLSGRRLVAEPGVVTPRALDHRLFKEFLVTSGTWEEHHVSIFHKVENYSRSTPEGGANPSVVAIIRRGSGHNDPRMKHFLWFTS